MERATAVATELGGDEACPVNREAGSPLRVDAAIAVGIAAGAFALYALTLWPDVTGGDGGEIVGAVASRGVIHPPGYPLYELLGRLFVGLPFGSLAWRVNLLSAVCDALAAALFYLATSRWTESRGAGTTTAALFAFSPCIWRYAICAEVFALNNLANAGLLFVAVLYDRRAERRYALLGALVVGLGLSNHHTILFSAVPLVAWALWRGRSDLLTLRNGGLLVTCFGVGLLPYLWLPIAAAGSPAVTWGAADRWAGFWTHVLRREYGTFQLAPSGIAKGAATETAAAWARDLCKQIGAWGMLPAALGIYACASSPRRRPLGVAILAASVLSVGVVVLLGNLPVTRSPYGEIVSRFWQQPDAFVFVLCGLGVAEIGRRTRPWVATALGGVALLVLPAAHFGAMNRHGSTLVRSYGAEILRAAPPGALMLTRGELITNTVRYLQLAEGMRSDVRVVDVELLGFSWYGPRVVAEHPEIVLPAARYMPGAPDGYVAKQLFDANIDRSPIVVCGGLKQGDLSADMAYGRWPWGLCEIVQVGAQPVNVDEWIRESDEALPRIDFRGQPHPAGSWEDIVWGDCWEVRESRAVQLLNVAGADPSRRRFLEVAASILQGIVDEDPTPPPRFYKTLALALGRQGKETPEMGARTAAAWKKYVAAAPADDPQLPAIKKELSRLTAP
jgi:hypothetical protein